MFKQILISVLLICSSFNTVDAEWRKKHFNLDDGVAIQGYDPVAYFSSSKAVKGQKKYSVVADGILYYCSSEINKAKFLKSYKTYEPQFGGWCAYAMAYSGKKVEINPETFKIKDGKLYLFYNAYFNNTLNDWNKDESNLKTKAENNWKKYNTN